MGLVEFLWHGFIKRVDRIRVFFEPCGIGWEYFRLREIEKLYKKYFEYSVRFLGIRVKLWAIFDNYFKKKFDIKENFKRGSWKKERDLLKNRRFRESKCWGIFSS